MRWANGWNTVLGMNARNGLISRDNPPRAIALVDDKHATKARLRELGAPVPDTVRMVRHGVELHRLAADDLPDAWACKPNRSMGGAGILLAGERVSADRWSQLSGRHVSLQQVATHARSILDGEFSPGGRDDVLFEPLLRPHPALAQVAAAGLPDIRILCQGETPHVAMLRLPTRRSDGRANLHAGGIGAAVDLETGRVTGALQNGRPIRFHPDTGADLWRVEVPHWDEVLAAARRCGPATGLNYVGADVVIDADLGPLILEVNARPGLEIQNVTGKGLSNLRKVA